MEESLRRRNPLGTVTTSASPPSHTASSKNWSQQPRTRTAVSMGTDDRDGRVNGDNGEAENDYRATNGDHTANKKSSLRPSATKRKYRKKRSKYAKHSEEEVSFATIFLQTAVTLAVLCVVGWKTFRFFVPAPPMKDVDGPYDDDFMLGQQQEQLDAGAASAEDYPRAQATDSSGGPDISAIQKAAAAEAKSLRALNLLPAEGADSVDEAIPSPLPIWNLTSASEFDAFALLQRFGSRRRADPKPAPEERIRQLSHSHTNSSSLEAQLSSFWETAQTLWVEFSDYYGGTNAGRALLERAVSRFAGPNGTTEDRAESTIPSDLQFTACRILDARRENRPFRFAFGGYSVTVGRGNYFHQSFPLVMRRQLTPAFAALGMDLQVANAAIGGCPSFPYGWCLPNFLGPNPDVVSWDFSMNEAGGDPNGLEAYLRHVMHQYHPKIPKVIVKDTYMADQRRELLRYYHSPHATHDVASLGDSLALHVEPAFEPFLRRAEFERPPGFQEWRKFGAPLGAPGQALHHPAVKEHELIAWVLTMHFLAAMELVAAYLEHPSDTGLQCPANQNEGGSHPLRLPIPTADLTTSPKPWDSMLFGRPVHDDKQTNSTTAWSMNPIHCRTSFQPLMAGSLTQSAVAGSNAEDLDIMLPKSKMFYNRGWVLDLSEGEKKAKRNLEIHGGLGFVDSKRAYYGLKMSGQLNLLLPYEHDENTTTRGQNLPSPQPGDAAIQWFRSVILCKVNEKDAEQTCRMETDVDFSIGGISVTKNATMIDAAGTLYLGKKLCVHLPVPPGAVLKTPKQIRTEQEKLQQLRNNQQQKYAFPEDETSLVWDTKVGLPVGVEVRNPHIIRREQACSIAHAVWEQTTSRRRIPK